MSGQNLAPPPPKDLTRRSESDALSVAAAAAGLDAALGRAAEALSDERNLAALRLSAATQSLAAALPATAPVSSLLPPIPVSTSTPALQAAQLAVLLNHAAPAPQPNQSFLPPTSLRTDAGSVFGAPAPTAASLFTPLIQHAAPPSLAAAAAPSAAEMQSWSINRLEKHAELLNKLSQPIPQTLALQLAEARRKEQKKQAKRVANRISASSSRQRKKTMVKEMTEMNAHLKRQALILALLPDLVIVVNRVGVITFCSAQVERVLHHQLNDLIGVPLVDLLVPNSRRKLNNLVKQLLEYEKAATSGLTEAGAASMKELGEEIDQNADKKCRQDKTLDSKDSRSFPMKEVQVKGPGKATEEVNDNSDMSMSNQESSNKEPSTLTRSPTSSSMEGNSGLDKERKSTSSDNSNTSSLSVDAKKLQKANANLVRNVRWHNKKRKDKQHPQGAFMDDVTGAEVTANNAGARLSSLLQRSEPPSSGEDSGYRESNDSREETSSSSDSSESNGRPKPIAPTCNICLIKSDMSTIWCEVTSSIRTLDKKEEEEPLEDKSKKGTKSISDSKTSSKGNDADSDPSALESGSNSSKEEIKEFLLCLRPIRDGKEKLDPKYAFVPTRMRSIPPIVSESSKAATVSSGAGSKSSEDDKKRERSVAENDPPAKRCRADESIPVDKATVVESMIMMSNPNNQ